MGVQLARAGVAALGLLLILSALGVMVAGGPVAFLPAVVLFTSGAVLLVGSVAERLRYRSIAAERDGHPPGPGGGEPLDAPVEARPDAGAGGPAHGRATVSGGGLTPLRCGGHGRDPHRQVNDPADAGATRRSYGGK